MAAAVQLKVSEVSRAKFHGRSFFYVQLEVLDSVDIPLEIFLWRKGLYNPVTGEQHDEFVTVCGPYDLVTYPAGEPLEGQSPAFFRREIGIIKAPAISVADEALTLLKDMVATLCATVDQSTALEEVSITWIPAE